MKKDSVRMAPPAWADLPDIELYMDQVIGVLEKHLIRYFPEEKYITSTMINNYVKQKLLPPPQNKRYTRGQLARLFMICILKSFMQLSHIASLLDALGKTRDDEALFTLFAGEMKVALSCVFDGAKAPAEPETLPENALHTALMAFASILYARQSFSKAQAEFAPILPEEPKEKKKKEDKSEKKKEERSEKKKKD